MKAPRCAGCGLTVLELDGQYASLEAYCLDGADGEPPAESSGDWHLSCLRESGYGAGWSAALRRSYLMRGFTLVTESPSWSVLRAPHSTSTFALDRLGGSLDLPKMRRELKRISGGFAQALVIPTYNLHLDDIEVIADMQRALQTTREYPLTSLVEALGIEDRMLHPEVLVAARFRFTRQGAWARDWVTAIVEYATFIPDDLAALLPFRAR